MIRYAIIALILSFTSVYSQDDSSGAEEKPLPKEEKVEETTSPTAKLSLWRDRNLYSPKQSIPPGTVIRILFKKGLKAEYEYESYKEDEHKIRSSPDKKVVSDIMPYYSDRSIAKEKNAKTKSNAKFLGAMSVIVQAYDTNNTNHSIPISGKRSVIFDKDNEHVLELSGLISPMDIKKERTITSDKVANLTITLNSAPKDKKLEGIELKPVYNPDGTLAVDPDGNEMKKAELYETEKQRIMLEYLKRMLGESDFGENKNEKENEK